MIANWFVPEGDRAELRYLGSMKGHDMYYSTNHGEIVLRYGDLGEEYSAMEHSGPFWMAVEQEMHPKAALYKTALKRARLAGLVG